MSGAPDAARVMAAVRATWPPSALRRVGAFDLPAEAHGTRRGTAARPAPGAAPTEADVAALEAARPGGAVALVDGADDATAVLLEGVGHVPSAPNDLMAGPVSAAMGPLPPTSGFAHWPPLAICEAMWDAHGNDAARRAPMHRAPAPRTALLLRHADRAVGALFVGVDGDVAVLHLVLTLPRARRQGVGRLGLAHAAAWARDHGAAHLALPVEASNAGAVALYARAGLERVGGYRYWSRP